MAWLGVNRIPGESSRFPSSLSPETLAAERSCRIFAGAREAVWHHGYRGLTVQRMIEPAGISRPIFYELFADRDEAARAAHAEAVEDLDRCLREAWGAGGEWPARLRRGLVGAFAWAAADPLRANLLVGEFAVASPDAAAFRAALVNRYAPFLREGRCRGRPDLPEVQEELVIGGLAAAVASRLRSDPSLLIGLIPPMVRFLLAYYGGSSRL